MISSRAAAAAIAVGAVPTPLAFPVVPLAVFVPLPLNPAVVMGGLVTVASSSTRVRQASTNLLKGCDDQFGMRAWWRAAMCDSLD